MVVAFALVASGLGAIWSPPASAAEPWQAPQPGLGYTMDKRAGLWKDAWYSRDNVAKAWAKESYDPSYVNPTSFGSTFATQCVNEKDWNLEKLHIPTINTYRWTVDGTIAKTLKTCASTRLAFKGQGIHDVKLEVLNASNTVTTTKVRTVLVKDKLVVLLGDSAASGEGSPEANRTGSQEYGKWIDRRCHRSSNAAIPRAVQEMEDADPFTTITFLNFACSGATIERNIPEEGSGVLGPYVGIEQNFAGVDPANPSTYLPSQVDQLDSALTRQFRNQPGGGDPLRQVDKLFISGGINDLKFSKLASACVIFDHCVDKVAYGYGEGQTVANTLAGYAAAIPASFGKLDQALLGRDIVTHERYAMQYPDAFSKDSTGALCSQMLEDVIPMSSAIFIVTVLAVLLVFLHAFVPALAVVIDAVLLTLSGVLYKETGINVWGTLGAAVTGDLAWASDEIGWMKSTAMPALDKAVQDGAAAGNFTFVGGIADRFKGHGYCASDNWIVRAKQATYRQGPFNLLSRPLGFYKDSSGWHFGGLGINKETKGLMHPTPAGYEAAKKQIVATNVPRDGRTEPLFEDFRNHAPVAVNDTYTLDLNDDLSVDTGWGLGVLFNDKDVDGDELRTTLVRGRAMARRRCRTATSSTRRPWASSGPTRSPTGPPTAA